MKKIYSSYVLNIMSLIAFLVVLFYPRDFSNTVFWMIALLASFIFIGLTIVSYLIERTMYTSRSSVCAMNFPYEKIPGKIIYYVLFYLGLILGSCLGIGAIISIPLAFMLNI